MGRGRAWFWSIVTVIFNSALLPKRAIILEYGTGYRATWDCHAAQRLTVLVHFNDLLHLLLPLAHFGGVLHLGDVPAVVEQEVVVHVVQFVQRLHVFQPADRRGT